MNLVRPDKELFFQYAEKSFSAQHLTNHGPAVAELEQQLALFHGVSHCICMCSASMGIMLAAKAISLEGKSEVIVPSFAPPATVDALCWAGLVPCFCDVDPGTLTLSASEAKKHIGEATSLIVAPHPRIYLCNSAELEQLGKKQNIPVLFDSVEAFGSVQNGRKTGTFGNCEAFSFHAGKVLNACEGGYITTNDTALATQLRSTRAFGFFGKDNILHLGHNAKMNELHAAMALASLSRVKEIFHDNEWLHRSYQMHLRGLPGFTCVPYETHEKRNWNSLLVRLDSRWPFTLEETLAVLNAENIHARAYYAEPRHSACHQLVSTQPHFSVSEHVAQTHLLLPFGYTMSMEDTAVVGIVLHDLYTMRYEIKEALQSRNHHEA